MTAAIAQWRKAQANLPPGSEAASDIDAMIAEAEAMRGAPASSVPTPNAMSSGSAGTSAATDASAITGRVSLDPALRERVAPGDTLFIYARAVKGPPMPVAILRKTANVLPLDFRLDDSLAMSPAARLSTSGDVIVEARVSRSGNAAPATGDLQGRSAPLKPGARDVAIVIHDVVH